MWHRQDNLHRSMTESWEWQGRWHVDMGSRSGYWSRMHINRYQSLYSAMGECHLRWHIYGDHPSASDPELLVPWILLWQSLIKSLFNSLSSYFILTGRTSGTSRGDKWFPFILLWTFYHYIWQEALRKAGIKPHMEGRQTFCFILLLTSVGKECYAIKIKDIDK